jgi:hypothetical protein
MFNAPSFAIHNHEPRMVAFIRRLLGDQFLWKAKIKI